MVARLRVARLSAETYTPINNSALHEQRDALVSLISRYLPRINASLLTMPKVVEEGNAVEWYSELAGQPKRLQDLPANEQAAAKKLLTDRIHSIKDLAERLETVEPGSLSLKSALLQSVQYPDEGTIYVVEGQPVITFWGYQKAAQLPPSTATSAPLAAAGAALASNAALADETIATGREEQATDIPLTRVGKKRRWPWVLLLLALLTGLGWWFWDKLPFSQWFEPDYWAMYQAATGDCERIHALDEKLSAPDIEVTDALPAVKEAVAKERLECDTPDYWAMYQAATGDCDKIRQLEQKLSQPDIIESAELPVVKQAVIEERKQCDLPDYPAMYQETGGDCDKLKEFQAYLNQPDREVTPELPQVRQQVDADVLQCQIEYYQKMLDQAGDDCEKLQAITDPMAEIANTNEQQLQQIHSEYQARLTQCQLDDLQDAYDEAKQNCDQLKGFAASLEGKTLDTPKYTELQKQVQAGIAECNKPKETPKPETPPETKPEEPKESKEPEKKKAEVDPRQLCPGERPKELAPDLAIVFDASNSMNQSMTMGALGNMPNPGGILGMGMAIMEGMSEKRIDVAKKAAVDVVSTLPQDVDAGLVLVNECPSARQEGFYSPQQRQNLLRRISSIRTVGGTPLASGIQQASQMVDGVNAPAVIVVISDGSESCKGNPCATARYIASSKPLLKINVVDIMGTGAANCIAEATGGKVFTANNASDLQRMLNTAVEEVKGPANCIKR